MQTDLTLNRIIVFRNDKDLENTIIENFLNGLITLALML